MTAPGTDRTVVIGAGPAGLTAAAELAGRGRPVTVFEKDDQVGGIARTVERDGYRFDIGGHRFFTKVDEIQSLWERTMGEDFLVRPRLSRIYYRDRFFDYPLRPLNALANLGPAESAWVAASYLAARLFPYPVERTFEQWVVNRFGRRLFEIFFRTYTEKVWGIPCDEIGADWAAQRIKNLDLKSAVMNALAGDRARERDDGVIVSLIDRFHYPRLGPGMMWERFRDRLIDRGGEIAMETPVVGLEHDGRRIEAALVRRPDGRTERVPGSAFVSTMPLRELVRGLDPPPPETVRAAAARLRYRDFLTVVLVVDEPDVFPDNWIYIHAPDVRVGRIQNFKNWSPEMVPDPSRTSLGLEYFVQEDDELWSSSDADLVRLGSRETARLGLVDADAVERGYVVRMPKAYPVYDQESGPAVATIREWLSGLENLYPVGRNGQHRYNNQDHSMVTALAAARSILDEPRPIWDLQVEAGYHEEKRVGDRAVPRSADRTRMAELLRSAFARYDAVALGGATGLVIGGTLFAVTALALLFGVHDSPPLSLLGQYFHGYRVTVSGALIGLLEGLAGGFALGWLTAHAINALIGWHETVLKREMEAAGTLDPLAWGEP